MCTNPRFIHPNTQVRNHNGSFMSSTLIGKGTLLLEDIRDHPNLEEIELYHRSNSMAKWKPAGSITISVNVQGLLLRA